MRRSSVGKLFGSERLYGIDGGGATGGQIAGGDSAKAESENDEQNGGGIPCGGSVEERTHDTAGGPGYDESGSDSGSEQNESVTEDEPNDVTALRAEGETDAEFAGALADGVGEQAVDAGDGDEQGGESRDGEQASGEGLIAEGVIHDLLHRLEVLNSDFRLDGVDVVTDAVFDDAGDDTSAHGEIGMEGGEDGVEVVGGSELLKVGVELGQRGFAGGALMGVFNDADDGGPLARLALIANFDLLTEGALVEERRRGREPG